MIYPLLEAILSFSAGLLILFEPDILCYVIGVYLLLIFLLDILPATVPLTGVDRDQPGQLNLGETL